MTFENTFLITHKNCMDGSACAILFRSLGGKKENIYFSIPKGNRTDEFVSDLINGGWDGPVLIADLMVSVDVAEWLDTLGNVALFDHHKTSVPLQRFDFCTIDVKNEMCGAMMLDHEFCGALKYMDLIRRADDNDRWVHNYPESKVLASLHDLLGQEAFIDRFLRNPDIELTIQEKFLIDVHNRDRAIKTKSRKKNTIIVDKNIQGHDVRVGFVVAYGDNTSKLGNEICEDFHMDVDLVVIISGEIVSYRASKDCPVDVSVVAALNGGGGHRLASGGQLSGILGEDFLEMVMGRIKFE